MFEFNQYVKKSHQKRKENTVDGEGNYFFMDKRHKTPHNETFMQNWDNSIGNASRDSAYRISSSPRNFLLQKYVESEVKNGTIQR